MPCVLSDSLTTENMKSPFGGVPLSRFLVLPKVVCALHKVTCLLFPWEMELFHFNSGRHSRLESINTNLPFIRTPVFVSLNPNLISLPATLNKTGFAKRSFPHFYLWLCVQESLCLEGISFPSLFICVNVCPSFKTLI